MSTDAFTSLTNKIGVGPGGGTSQDLPSNTVYLGDFGPAVKSWSGDTRPGRREIDTIDNATQAYLNDPKLQSRWKSALRKYGFDADPLRAKAMWDLSVAGASEWYQQSNGQQKVTPVDYLAWYSKGSTKKKNVPTRQIYNYTPEEVNALIGKGVEAIAGRSLSPEDMQQDWYKDLNNAVNRMISKGTVTKVEMKGGEKVVTQTPGFSQEKAAAVIEKKLATALPEDIARKERVDFASFLFGEIGKNK